MSFPKRGIDRPIPAPPSLGGPDIFLVEDPADILLALGTIGFPPALDGIYKVGVPFREIGVMFKVTGVTEFDY